MLRELDEILGIQVFKINLLKMQKAGTMSKQTYKQYRGNLRSFK